MFTSCSPGWIKFMEYFHPDMLPNLSTCKSPQQMFGAVAKTYYADKLGKRPEEIFVVSIMPCTAKKFECQRPEMDASGVRDVDVVLTTRELGKMIRAAGIDFDQLARRRDGRPAGAVHRSGRHLRQHRRRDGSGPAHGLRDRHRPASCPWPTCTSRPSRGSTGVKEASLKIRGHDRPIGASWKA